MFGNLQQDLRRAVRLTPALFPIFQCGGTDAQQGRESILRQAKLCPHIRHFVFFVHDKNARGLHGAAFNGGGLLHTFCAAGHQTANSSNNSFFMASIGFAIVLAAPPSGHPFRSWDRPSASKFVLWPPTNNKSPAIRRACRARFRPNATSESRLIPELSFLFRDAEPETIAVGHILHHPDNQKFAS